MTAPRRAFLQGLATLPLIGGGVSLIGKPTAVAEPVTLDLLHTYKTWLLFEHRYLAGELAARPDIAAIMGGTEDQRAYAFERTARLIDVGDAARFHCHAAAQPSSRAALVLSTVGCGWDPRP